MTDDNYVKSYLPPSIVEKLEAGAFRSLCTHLKERSDEVQNIDLMTVSGFCRNCLAKWMVMEARMLSLDDGQQEGDETVAEALNALGYDEAAQYVYGCDYGDWKKRHAKKASEEQMQKYNDSTPLHSVFDKKVLQTRGKKPKAPVLAANSTPATSSTVGEKSLISNVCCQDVEEVVVDKPVSAGAPNTSGGRKARSLPDFVPPPAPDGGISFSVAVITVSDRAFKNEYSTGDLSGPAVSTAVQHCVQNLRSSACPVICSFKDAIIVPDEMSEIQRKLKELAASGVDLIFTTGGTGLAPRDVTPEATTAVVDRECHGLMSFVANECSKGQPLASLSRGTAGVLGNTMICNLPGNPKGVGEIVPILLPIVLHAINDLQTN